MASGHGGDAQGGYTCCHVWQVGMVVTLKAGDKLYVPYADKMVVDRAHTQCTAHAVHAFPSVHC